MTKASKLKKYLITHWEIWDMKSHYQPPQVDLSELNMFSYYLQIEVREEYILLICTTH